MRRFREIHVPVEVVPSARNRVIPRELRKMMTASVLSSIHSVCASNILWHCDSLFGDTLLHTDTQTDRQTDLLDIDYRTGNP